MVRSLRIKLLLLAAFLFYENYAHCQSKLLIYSNKGEVIGKIKHEDKVTYQLLGNDTSHKGYIVLDTNSTNKTHIWIGENRIRIDSISQIDSRNFPLIIGPTVLGLEFEAASSYFLFTGIKIIISNPRASLYDGVPRVIIGSLSGHLGYYLLSKRNNDVYKRLRGDLLIYEK
ncbi:MAG: hypothetical protein JKY53_14070 [Flavobacteriales bacterium]|nr:hypothetical protein [Flavobacteriales bacterium]